MFEKGRTKGIYKPRKRKKSKGWPNKISCMKDSVDTWQTKTTCWNSGFIKRFLLKNIGRKWNDIWSEVCSATKDRLGYKVRNAIECQVNSRYCHDFYIENGILKYKPYKKYKYHKRQSKIVRINGKCYFQYQNIWYEIFPEPIPKTNQKYKPVIKDVFHTYTLFPDTIYLTDFYGEHVYSRSKRSANSKEIKKIHDSRTLIQ